MNHKVQFLYLFAIIAFLLSPSWSRNAHAFNDDLERYTQVKITPERTTIRSGDEITIATEIKLAPHWHVYWKNPGDSGLPVEIRWETPDGFEVEDINWPTPDKISYDILSNYGYYDKVILLQTLKVPNVFPKGKNTLTATVDMLVCNEICIPESSTISIDLNNTGNPKVGNSSYIKAAKSKLAKTINGHFEYSENDNALILSITPEDHTLLSEATQSNLEFFPVDWGVINHVAMPDVKIKNGTVTISHERGDQPLSEIKELRGLLVIKGENGENKGFALAALPKEASSAPVIALNQSDPNEINKEIIRTADVHTDKVTWFSAIYLAIFGGLILNLMPCVFPVLSIKALSLVQMGEKENKLARTHGIAYTLGVVLSFLIIGGALLVFKEAGSIIGWGFQLQSPIVVTILAYLLFVIGLNFIGFFDFSSNFSNAGNKLTKGQSLSSSFFTGALATIVATPCTAPFMGAAMGFAMTQPAAISMSVFAALGFGLALPYLILSYVPPLRKALPKPGAWMDVFKQFLAFPMFAFSIWLVWVLSQQSGSYGVLLVLLGMLSIAFCVWLSHLKSKGIGKTLTTILLISCMSLPFFSLTYINNTGGAIASSDKVYSFGEPFSPEKLLALLEGNDPVFVEMTAAWCITCKVNHAIAINTDSTKAVFEEYNVHYLIGDWTNHDDTITQYLAAFNRNGVPIYVFYGKRDPQTGKRPESIILPQVLTPAIVKETIGK